MPFSNSILSRLTYQHETIAELIGNLNDEQLKQQINPGKWTVFDNIVHLAAYQPTFIDRIEKITAGGDPLFERYVAENDPLFYAYQKMPVVELLARIDGDRKLILHLLGSLHEDDLDKTARHPRYGKLDLPKWVHFFLLHEAHHLWVILQMVYHGSSPTEK